MTRIYRIQEVKVLEKNQIVGKSEKYTRSNNVSSIFVWYILKSLPCNHTNSGTPKIPTQGLFISISL